MQSLLCCSYQVVARQSVSRGAHANAPADVACGHAQLVHMLGGAKNVAEMTGRLGGTALDEETGKHVFYARNQDVRLHSPSCSL